MSAAGIASALGNAQRSGRWCRCRCPVHASRGPTLVLGDDDHGLIVHCHAGCDSRDIFAELRRRRLVEDRGERYLESRSSPLRHDNVHGIAVAHRLWEAGPNALGSPVRRYLRSRGIQMPSQHCLRWAPACRHPSGRGLPAMLARIDNVDGELIGVHRTFLRPDGSGKANVEPQKAMLGLAAGGAVRLGAAEDTLLIGEGIETTMAGMVATGLPGWAALSTSGLVTLALPPNVRQVVILADHDANGAGKRAARAAAQRWLSEGRRVRIAMPPEPGTDFNDLLLDHADARIAEERDVAA
jgi:putative DNA primase/helicase